MLFVGTPSPASVMRISAWSSDVFSSDLDGTPVELDVVRGEFTKSVNGEDRVGFWSFTPPGDSVEVTCRGDDQLDVEVGPSAISGSRMAIMGIGFGLSALLGVIGLILLITALVRWSRRSRS